MKVAFTGHRPHKLGGYNDTKNRSCTFYAIISRLLRTLDSVTIISGMALGVDTWAAKLALWNKYPLHVYIPFKGQEATWPENSQREYRALLDYAESVIYCSTPGYSAHKMQIRNERMVDACDLLIAVWDGTNGGTKNCLDYAKKRKTNILLLTPSDLHKGAGAL